MSVVVVGSINLDIVCEVDQLPAPGQTVLARRTRRNVGGKGSNQAVAAALAGASVSFVGRVGRDDAGVQMAAALAERGIDIATVRTVDDVSSGVAYIVVADDNIITVDSGANMCWQGSAAVDQEEELICSAAVVVSQLEVPMEVVAHAAALTRGRFVLNAAPSVEVSDQVLQLANPLVVNEHELAALSRVEVAGVEQARLAAMGLLERGVGSIVVTLGGAGALWFEDGHSGLVPAPAATVVDTTGAGDAFVGNLAASLAGGASLGDATTRAVIAATLSVQRPGTHDSYPDQATLDAAVAAPEL